MNPLLVPEPRASSNTVIMQTAMALIAHAVLDDTMRMANPTSNPKENLLNRLPSSSATGSTDRFDFAEAESRAAAFGPEAAQVVIEAREARRLRNLKKQAQGHWRKS